MKKSKLINLLPPVFDHLLRNILIEANEELRRQGLVPRFAPLTPDTSHAQLFGTGKKFLLSRAEKDEQKITSTYAIHCKMRGLYGESWYERFGIRHAQKINGRILQDALARYNALPDEDKDSLEHTIALPENYLDLFLQFINLSLPEDLLAGNQFTEVTTEIQQSLFQKDAQEIESPQKPPEKILHYTCYFLDDADPNILQECQVIFEFQPEQTIVHFLKTPSEQDYRGFLQLNEDKDQAVIFLTSIADPHHQRPLILVIKKNNQRPFPELPICVGSFININSSGRSYTGIMLLEQITSTVQRSALEQDLVKAYLQRLGNQIPIGGFHKVEDFLAHAESLIPQWKQARAMIRRLEGRYFECFILSKRRGAGTGNEPNKRLERTLFHFMKNGRFECYNAYSSDQPYIYTGQVEYHSLNKLILRFNRKDNGVYLLPIELGESETISEFSGVYGGVTQDNTLAAGRARFYAINKKTFQTRRPRTLEFSDEEARIIMKEHPELNEYFAGRLDKHLDEVILPGPDLDFLTADANSDLGPLPGTYYYYRTRTIKAHTREVKRSPVIIYPDGRLEVKVIDEGDLIEATGRLVRRYGRAYLFLSKRERHIGLAILYPDWNGPLREAGAVIPGVYTTTSNANYLMAGRLFFRRHSDDTTGKDFQQLLPQDISIDDLAKRSDVDPGEFDLIRHLCGQINSYIAIRTPFREQPHQNFGEELFLAACYLARSEKNTDWAIETLKKAVLYGAYRNIPRLQQEICREDGAFYPFQEAIRNMPNAHNPKDQQGQDREIFLYLQKLVREIFE